MMRLWWIMYQRDKSLDWNLSSTHFFKHSEEEWIWKNMFYDVGDDGHYYIIEIKKVVGFYDPLFSVLVYPAQ